MRILVISATFPSPVDPNRGVFVKERIKALSELDQFKVKVIAPVPWFPPIPIFKSWHKWSQVPTQAEIEGLEVHYPRYLLPPKIGGYFHSELMYRSVLPLAKKLRKDFDFDLIDSHFVYPSGVVAAKLAAHFAKPVTMTGRGEDMLSFPNHPVVGDRIRWALSRSSKCIGVSREIADAMLANRAAPEKTTVLANGIDSSKFQLLSQPECRARLKLPADRQIILSVGEMIPRKGFELLLEAMPSVIAKYPDVLLVIVGRAGRFGRDNTSALQTKIEELALQNHVLLPGPCPHDELVLWFNSADLFGLMSASEGSPNVLLEALASGTPSMATPVGGIPDELADNQLGILLPERSSEAASVGICEGLGRNWDRVYISEKMKERTWTSVAQRFAQLLEEAKD